VILLALAMRALLKGALLMISHPEGPPQDPLDRRRAEPRTDKRLLTKIRMSKWRQDELEWLLASLGPALTPAIAIEIRSKLHALQTEKGVR
jgi:hypothetical protein